VVRKTTGHSAEEVKHSYLTQLPFGRFATPDDVASIVAFLCSHDFDYMTGQALNVTGGQVMI